MASSKRSLLTAQQLRAAVDYYPATGIFRWREDRLSPPNPPRSAHKAGDRAGGVTNGYRYISIGRERHKASRLAWLYMTGEWPSGLVDHRDTVTDNDAWSNLREADKSGNAANTGLSVRNTSGLKGACFDKRRRKWVAQIRVQGRQHNLGRFDTAEAAHAAYVAAAFKHFGEFARTS